MNPIDKVAHCSKLGVFTSKMMLEKINCNSILFIGEDIMNIIHEYVHWNTTMKIWSKRKIAVQLRIYCIPV